jgi:two-component system response regulator DevR
MTAGSDGHAAERSYPRGVRVLVVDDSSVVRARLVALLGEARGVVVVAEAWDGREAVRLARSHAPDAVVLDLNLPGISGLEVLAILKAEPSPPVVIILTNHPLARYRAACLRSGADFFFDKSIDFDHAVAAVTSLASGATPKS